GGAATKEVAVRCCYTGPAGPNRPGAPGQIHQGDGDSERHDLVDEIGARELRRAAGQGREMSRPFSFLGSDARPTGPKPANARCNAAGASLPTEPSLHPRTLVFQHPAS